MGQRQQVARDNFISLIRRKISPLVNFLSRYRVHPDTLSLTGFVLNFMAAGFFGMGWLLGAGILLLLGGFLDVLDGEFARRKNETSRYGAFLDSVLDRYSESAVF